MSILDETGRPTPAAVRLYDSQGAPLVPEGALELGGMGYLYEPGKLIGYADWTSSRLRSQAPNFGSNFLMARQRFPRMASCFVDGGFKISLPPGAFQLTVSRGYEYLPVEKMIVMQPDRDRHEIVQLARWVDMAARGWYSGDGHVHIERPGPEADPAVLLWAAAEDIHVANVLEAGDAKRTYYPQYAFRPAGTATDGDRVIAPGQEDPRSAYLGHTLHLNTAGMARDPDRYYLYAPIFERQRDRGGLSGFAHVGRRTWVFAVDRGLTLLAPRGLVDFAEIGQMGYIGVNLWYEFLNLGFRITAMAGSDVPWGGTIGHPRVYCHLGPGGFDVARWFEAVRRGHTFVTTGPMLEFTVNGLPPGSVLRLKQGETISIKAKARGGPPDTVPVELELVSFGRTLQKETGKLETEMSFPATHSLWITARCQTNREPLMDRPGFFAGAIAPPVFVEVDGRPCRDVDNLPELIQRRLDSLDAIQEWMRAGVKPGGMGNY